MESKTARYYGIAVLITFFTTCTYFVALGPINLWWELWFAPLPLILYSFYGKKSLVLVVTFLSFVLSTILVNFAYWHNTLIPFETISFLIVAPGLIISLIVLSNSIIVKRWTSWLSMFFFPTAMVAVYLLHVLLANNFLLLEHGFTQYHFLLLAQITSLTGIWGINFLLNLLPNSIAIIIYWRQKKNIYLPTLIITSILLIGTIAFGYYKISQPIATTKIRVGIAAHPYKETVALTLPLQVAQDLANPYAAVTAYLNNIEVLAKQGAKYILQPEYAIVLPQNFAGMPKILNTFKQTAKKYQLTIFFAFGEFAQATQEIKSDQLIIFSPQGNIIGTYQKQHLVPAPFHENRIKPGNRIVTFPYQTSTLGVAICRDMLHIDPSREYGKKSTGMLFVPALDFSPAEAGLAARVAIMQSIANGFSLARSAAYGYLLLNDYNGKMIAIKKTSQTDRVYLVGDVPLGKGNTFYARHGNWFAWLCVVLTFLIIILQFIKSNGRD